jgi:hypothetical protein
MLDPVSWTVGAARGLKRPIHSQLTRTSGHPAFNIIPIVPTKPHAGCDQLSELLSNQERLPLAEVGGCRLR